MTNVSHTEVRTSTLDRHNPTSDARLGDPDDRIKMTGPPLPKPRKITRKPPSDAGTKEVRSNSKEEKNVATYLSFLLQGGGE